MFTLEDVTFFGCTLWTDFSLFRNKGAAAIAAYCAMPDYRKIRMYNILLRPSDTIRFFENSVQWLESSIKQCSSKKKVIITHHGPSIRSVSAEFQGDILTASYVSSLSWFIDKYEPDYWIHGHTHNNADYLLNGCRIICNPRGFKNEWSDFDSCCIIEL
jgi:Icc-related predicted phosphoesterase